MDAGIMKRGVILIVLLTLGACKGMGLSSLDTYEADKPDTIGPGISSLNTESEEQAKEQKWFDGYYGSKHGWGWDVPKEKDDNCSFYGNCDSKNSLGW